MSNIASFNDRFCPEGQKLLEDLIATAKVAGVSEEMICQALETQWREHWVYKAPEICGAIITNQDRTAWQWVYQSLKLSVPSNLF